jgi:uncharacterized protein (TIGR02466 family)
MSEIKIANFAGLPILVGKKSYIPSKEEINFITKSPYILSENKESNLMLSKNKYVLEEPKLININNFIKKNVDIYLKKVLQINNSFKLCNSWFTLQNIKTKHHPHVHPNTLVSVVYYAKCSDSKITFSKDRSILSEGYHFEYDVIEHNQYNAASWNVDVETGDIIIFPGWLRHEASNNSLKEKRYVIAANYFIEGESGNNKNATYLKI